MEEDSEGEDKEKKNEDKTVELRPVAEVNLHRTTSSVTLVVP